MAGTLTNILKVISGPKRYVSEIKRNSSSIAAINDAFRNYAGDLQLRSFYETMPSNMMLLNTVVVDKDSAILGYDRSGLPCSTRTIVVCASSIDRLIQTTRHYATR